jgi:hypothetical protein
MVILKAVSGMDAGAGMGGVHAGQRLAGRGDHPSQWWQVLLWLPPIAATPADHEKSPPMTGP